MAWQSLVLASVEKLVWMAHDQHAEHQELQRSRRKSGL
jgi:hypothetical protein